jgi:transposase
VHAVLAACGVQVAMSDLFELGGQQLLQRVELPPAFRARIGSATRVLECLDFEIEVFTNLVTGRLRGHRGYTAIQVIPGVGAILGAVFVAEIGNVHRFRRPSQLSSWAGLTPQHHESDTKVHRGRITKQGSKLVRWAAVEAVQKINKHSRLGQIRDQVGSRRGRNIGVVAAARELLTLVFYGLRDGHIRCLQPTSP